MFYNWIIHSEDVKLVFLSGTPIINKPAEIAILYNMLRGMIHVYNFSVETDKEEDELQNELKEIYYQDDSLIDQIHCSKKQGKMISFTKQKSNFVTVRKDGSIQVVRKQTGGFLEFFDEIFNGIERFLSQEKNLSPIVNK